MKKTTLIVFSLVMVSCSKTYICRCQYKTNGVVVKEDTHKVSEGSKSKSANTCSQGDASSTTTVSGVTFENTVECELAD